MTKTDDNLTTFDPAEHLTNDEEIAQFMADAFESQDAGYIAHALGVVARARGMSQLARQAGLSREHLYRSFSEGGNPTLKTMLSVMSALGISLSAKAAPAEHISLSTMLASEESVSVRRKKPARPARARRAELA